MRQGIGEISGDRERAALGDDIDLARLHQEIDRLAELLGRQHFLDMLQGYGAGGTEAGEEMVRPVLLLLGAVERQAADAFRIARRAAGERRLEDALHLAKAGIVQGLCKSNQRRGRDPRPFGDHHHGFQRDVVRMIEHELGDLLQPVAQAVIALGNAGAQRRQILGGIRLARLRLRLYHCHSSPSMSPGRPDSAIRSIGSAQYEMHIRLS